MQQISKYIRFSLLGILLIYVAYSFTRGYFPYDIDIDESKYITKYHTAKNPEDILRLYLDIDKNGGYLSKGLLKVMRNINHKNLFIQQEMETILLISGYKIVPVKSNDNRHEYTVIYNVVATVDSYFSYKRTRKTENLHVAMKNISGKWFIDTQIFPHIDKGVYLNYIKKHSDKEYKSLKGLLSN